jgi:hypothetical protein
MRDYLKRKHVHVNKLAEGEACIGKFVFSTIVILTIWPTDATLDDIIQFKNLVGLESENF